MKETILILSCSLCLAVANFLVLGSFKETNLFSTFKKVLLIGVFSLSSIILYAYWGNFHALHQFWQHLRHEKDIQLFLKKIKNTDELITRLQDHLKHESNSAKGWFLLGRLFMSQEKWQEARNALNKANQLKPYDESTLVNYAWVEWQLNHERLSPTGKKLIDLLLKKNKNQPDALSLLAMNAFKLHDYEQAIDYWNALLTQIPAQSEAASMIRRAIAKAEGALHERQSIPSS